MAKGARERKIPVILDAGSVHEGTVALAQNCDCLAASWKFARDMSGKKDPEGALEFLSRIAPLAVVTLGEAGLVWASGDQRGKINAFPVEAVDTTGAGDVFHGALGLAIARGTETAPALRYAAAAAALACARMGARASIPTKSEVEAFLEKFPDR
jgi:sulfofructose kinase